MTLQRDFGEALAGPRLIRGSDVRVEEVRWLGPGLPIGNGTLMAGPAGLAKTTLMCEWAARVTRGQMRGALYGRPADVVLMSGEDAIENTLAPRFLAAGGDPDHVYFLDFGEEDFVVPDELDRLATLIATLPAPAMIGIDPLMAFVADRIDSHKDHHVRRVFSAARRFASSLDVAVVVVSHLNKAESRDFLTRVNGSVGIGAAVRSAWAVVEHPDDPGERALVHVKSNLGPFEPSERFRIETRYVPGWDGRMVETSGIAWLGQDPSLTRSNVLEAGDPDERTERDEAADWLRAFLADGPHASRATIIAAKGDGISERTLRRAKAEIGVVANQDRGRGGQRVQGWEWRLPTLDGQRHTLPRGHLENEAIFAGSGHFEAPSAPLDGHMATPLEPGQVESAPPDPICIVCGLPVDPAVGDEIHPMCAHSGGSPADVDAVAGEELLESAWDDPTVVEFFSGGEPS
jgi:hypothetical protein